MLWTAVVLGAVAVLTINSSIAASAFGVPVVIALLKLGVRDRVQAVILAYDAGLVAPAS